MSKLHLQVPGLSPEGEAIMPTTQDMTYGLERLVLHS